MLAFLTEESKQAAATTAVSTSIYTGILTSGSPYSYSYEHLLQVRREVLIRTELVSSSISQVFCTYKFIKNNFGLNGTKRFAVPASRSDEILMKKH